MKTSSTQKQSQRKPGAVKKKRNKKKVQTKIRQRRDLEETKHPTPEAQKKTYVKI